MASTLTTSEMEKILLREESDHIKEICWDEEYMNDGAIPKIDLSLWKGESKQEDIDFLINYVRGPYIIDDFKSSEHDSKRKPYQMELFKKYDWFYDFSRLNVLRGNAISSVGIVAHRLKGYDEETTDYVGTEPEKFESLRQKLERFNRREFGAKYREITDLEAQIRIAKDIKSYVCEFLQFLSKQEPL
jgi:hypothetical protein